MKLLNINKFFLALAFIALGLGFTRCGEEFIELSNPNEIDAEIFFDRFENFDLALTSVYSAVKSFDLYGSDYIPKVLYGIGHTADQDWTGHSDWNHFFTHEVVPEDGILSNTWRAWWRVVGRANDVLENIDLYVEKNNPTQSQIDHLNEIKGQALFLRAFAYFHMVNLWGETGDPATAQAVPIVELVPKTKDDMMVARNSVADVYAFIEKDLMDAGALLPESWSGNNIARVDKWAVKGLLAKVYLYQNDISNAKTSLEDIVKNGGFSLVPAEDYSGLFHGDQEFSSESIFELNLADDLTESTWDGGLGSNIALLIAPFGTGWSNINPHDENVRRFGADPRLKINMLQPGVDSVVLGNGDKILLQKFPKSPLGWSFKKYVPLDHSVYSTNRNYGANINLMRLADYYLMYAEVLNGSDDATALEYVNKVRRRAYGFDANTPNASVDWSGLSGNQLRDSIREERFRELFGEGHRAFDLKRWGIMGQDAERYDRVASGELIFDDPKDYTLPIPLNELEKNTAMTQTKGFE